MPDDSSLNDFRKKFYGEPIFSYADQDAVADGILIPFVVGKKDTLHRITSNAFNELSEYHRQHNYPDYETEDFYRFFFSELLPLIPEAHRVYDQGSSLKTTYDFEVTEKDSEILWYLPNEVNGITMMLPSDY